MSDLLIKVDGVSKKFCRSLKRSMWYGLKDLSAEITGRKNEEVNLRIDEFWALNDISFELRRGECLGLIGHNGAGKTTLLRILNGLIKPDRGIVEMRGRASALISLGAGFNSILTGRENIYVSGLILGLKKAEINKKLDEIIDFSGLKEFIDSPVQSYSSGMQVRLGFSIAVALTPDILILDEILAVGDAAFRAKCYTAIGKMMKNAAVIFVSHNMQEISQVSSQVMYLNRGNVAYFGDKSIGQSHYVASSSSDQERLAVIERPLKNVLIDIQICEITYGDLLNFKLKVESSERLDGVLIRIPFYDIEGKVVAEWQSKNNGNHINFPLGKSEIAISIGPIFLAEGRYFLGIVINDSTGAYMPYWSLRNHEVRVVNSIYGATAYQLPTSKHIDFYFKD